MRGTRWLLLVAIAVTLFGVAMSYRTQTSKVERQIPAKPQPLPPELTSASEDWHYEKTDQQTHCKIVEVSAKNASTARDSSRTDLRGQVTLRIFHKCEAKHDVVESEAASFFPNEGRLYAEGPVRITLGVAGGDDDESSLVTIESSGITFDTATGHAETDQPAKFIFKNGEGTARGASYDPDSHDLLMKNDVKIDWRSSNPDAKPMHIEAPSLAYHESSLEIDLVPSGKLTRGDAVFEGENPVVHLQVVKLPDGKKHTNIHEVDGTKVHGSDVTPTRKLQYAADRVWVNYNDQGEVQKISGEGNSRVVSVAEFSETTATSDRVDLLFDPQPHENILTNVTSNGHAVVTSKPIAVAGHDPGETHVLRSEAIELKMRPGGKEMESVVSHVPGTIEFLPNQPTQHHRTLQGREIAIVYGPQNHMDSFHALDAKTTTEPNAEERRRNRGVSVISSREMAAHFEPRSSQLAIMEQTGSCNYQEGDRKARAEKCSFDAKQDVIVLEKTAFVSDATGSTAADVIRMDQRSGDFLAIGNVNSTRLPDKDQKKNSSMLSGDAPLQAQAQRMESSNRPGNRRTKYEGNALLWQGANRLQAHTIEIDRDKHTLVADGNVISDLWEQPKADSKKAGAAAVLTKVSAPHLVYTDENRLAAYTGGVKLDRGGMLVQSRNLQAWLAESDADSRLDRAFADGAVDILGASKGAKYHANSEHAEYYTDDQRIVLNGGAPQVVKTENGKTTTIEQGQLTYYPNDGSLRGTGAANDRVPNKSKK
jgi:lipopolysaccharide export system protein LptA